MILRLLRFLLLVGVVYVLYRVLWKGEGLGFFRTRKKKRTYESSPGIIEEMKKDPVCGTYVPENQAVKYSVNHTTYYFCSEQCKQKFRELKEKE